MRDDRRSSAAVRFAVRTKINRFDLDSVPGRMQALRAAAPVVAGIRDRASRPEYGRRLARSAGMPVERSTRRICHKPQSAKRLTPAVRRVRTADRRAASDSTRRPTARAQTAARPSPAGRRHCRCRTCATPRSPESVSCCRSRSRRPTDWTPRSSTRWAAEAFGTPAYRLTHEAIRAAGGLSAAGQVQPEIWVEQVAAAATEQARPIVTELAVAPMLVRSEDGLARLATSLQVEIAGRDLLRQEAEVHSRMQRLDAAGDAIGFRAALVEAEAIVRRRTALRDRLG